MSDTNETNVTQTNSESAGNVLNAIVLSAVIKIKEGETDTVETNSDLGVVLQENQLVNLQYSFWTMTDRNVTPPTQEGWDTIMILVSGDGVHTIHEMIQDPSKYSSHIITGVNVIKNYFDQIAQKYDENADDYIDKLNNISFRDSRLPMLVSGYMGKDMSVGSTEFSSTDRFRCFMEGDCNQLVPEINTPNIFFTSKMLKPGSTEHSAYNNRTAPSYKLLCDQIWDLRSKIEELQTSLTDNITIQSKVSLNESTN